MIGGCDSGECLIEVSRWVLHYDSLVSGNCLPDRYESPGLGIWDDSLYKAACRRRVVSFPRMDLG